MPAQFGRSHAALALLAVWPLDVRLALCTTAPSDYALGAEYAATGYARQTVRRVVVMPPTPPPILWTADAVTFGPFTGNVGAEVGWVMAFPPTGATTVAELLMYWELDEHKTPVYGESISIGAGDLAMSFE